MARKHKPRARGENRAAKLYAMIGGIAANQAIAIELGWEPDCKKPGHRCPTGTKIARLAALGACTVRHRSNVDSWHLSAKAVNAHRANP